jgi:hypothetical protein
MTESMHRLVYYSLNNLSGSHDDVDRVLRDILDVARRNNARLNVTGALMFNSSCFLQVLEGPRGAVENLFRSIQRDVRHRDVTLLSFTAVAERAFGHWSMAFVGAQDFGGRLDAFAAETGFDPAHMTGEATFQFLHKLVLDQEQASSRGLSTHR